MTVRQPRPKFDHSSEVFSAITLTQMSGAAEALPRRLPKRRLRVLQEARAYPAPKAKNVQQKLIGDIGLRQLREMYQIRSCIILAKIGPHPMEAAVIHEIGSVENRPFLPKCSSLARCSENDDQTVLRDSLDILRPRDGSGARHAATHGPARGSIG